MKVFIACECSGVGRRAFAAAGHDTISCDMKEPEDQTVSQFAGIDAFGLYRFEWLLRSGGRQRHYVGDCFEILEYLEKEHGWKPDLIIAHPPCTYMANSGISALDEPKRQYKKTTILRGAARWQAMREAAAFFNRFKGRARYKRTCLWLEGLPLLKETNNVKAEMDKLPIKERQKCWWGGSRSQVDRSRSYTGILQAMVDQWGKL